MSKTTALSSPAPGSAEAVALGVHAAAVRATSRLEGLWAVLLVLGPLLVTPGCEDEPTALLLDVRTNWMISKLAVQVKRYENNDARSVYVYPPPPDIIIPETLDGYLVHVGGDPLRLNIELPGDGSYAVHIVGVPIDDPATKLISTTCYDVSELHYDPTVQLGRLTQGSGSLDVDSDTFPEDYNAYCEYNSELRCDRSCESVMYNAAQDCNPAEQDPEWQPPAACPDAERGPDADWNPFAIDLCGDCLDRDCYAGDAMCEDLDQDGYPNDVDCDDGNAAINPGAAEICGNLIDENCRDDLPACTDGDVPCDSDADGYLAMHPTISGCGNDCDDTDPAVRPGAFEGFGSNPANPDDNPGCGDGVDNDCDGRIDERCVSDLDDDGLERHVDCNDCNAAIGQGFADPCGNGVDEDCADGDAVCSMNDADRDGYDEPVNDCNGSDARIFNGAPEYCGDDVAQDCNYDVDCTADSDGDHYNAGDDCDDANPAAHPWADELCDAAGVDEDCDGQVNEVLPAAAGTMGCGFNRNGDDQWAPIDYMTDEEHCGVCNHACFLGAAFREGDHCEGGACMCFDTRMTCPGGPTAYCCPDGCQDIASSEINCGWCGHQCLFGEDCRPDDETTIGVCWCDFETPPMTCDPAVFNACCASAGCTNTNDDLHNCGACDFDCTDPPDGRVLGDICSAGSCYCGVVGGSGVCTGTTWCTEVTEPPGNTCGCADLNNDVGHCGTCDTHCDEAEQCIGGSCVCPYTGTDCGGPPGSVCCVDVTSCVDLLNDENNCGICGVRCGPGEDCITGACVCGPGNDCNDGDPCTDDTCNGSNRCEHHPKDTDRDGYCDNACSGCDDCDDNNPGVNPGRTETCATGYDDDCDGDNNDLNATGCTRFYRDRDADGYGHTTSYECRCAAQGEFNETNNTDCNDTNGAIHPGPGRELCNDIDDDCDGSTADGANDCSGGGAAYCCGSTHACRTCCTDSQCPGVHPDCTASFTCACQTGWTSCGGTCNCNTAGDYCCSAGGACINTAGDGAGTGCCSASDCGPGAWSCTANRCVCATEVCSGNYCRTGSECCDPADCGTGAWTCSAGHVCGCSVEVCSGGFCRTAGECCDGADCGAGTWTCSAAHACSCPVEICMGNYCRTAGQCCDGADCGAGTWTCSAAHACSCPVEICTGNYCRTAGQCCDDGDCSAALEPDCNEPAHECFCDGEGAPCTSGMCCASGCGECCNDDHCSAVTEPDCNESNRQCFCAAEGASCSPGQRCCSTGCEECCVDGDCDGGEVCCGGTCYAGTCCNDGDCSGQNPDCDETVHTCFCDRADDVCEGSEQCCSNGPSTCRDPC